MQEPIMNKKKKHREAEPNEERRDANCLICDVHKVSALSAWLGSDVITQFASARTSKCRPTTMRWRQRRWKKKLWTTHNWHRPTNEKLFCLHDFSCVAKRRVLFSCFFFPVVFAFIFSFATCDMLIQMYSTLYRPAMPIFWSPFRLVVKHTIYRVARMHSDHMLRVRLTSAPPTNIYFINRNKWCVAVGWSESAAAACPSVNHFLMCPFNAWSIAILNALGLTIQPQHAISLHIIPVIVWLCVFDWSVRGMKYIRKRAAFFLLLLFFFHSFLFFWFRCTSSNSLEWYSRYSKMIK